MADYSTMTNDEFDEILIKLVEKMSAPEILAINGVATTLREELNNEVLEQWETDNPERAFPDETT